MSFTTRFVKKLDHWKQNLPFFLCFPEALVILWLGYKLVYVERLTNNGWHIGNKQTQQWFVIRLVEIECEPMADGSGEEKVRKFLMTTCKNWRKKIGAFQVSPLVADATKCQLW